MRFVTPLLWAATAVCLLAGGFLLLIACDFAKPAFLNFGGAFCPKKVNLSDLQRERDRKGLLLQQIHDAELHLAEKPDCSAPAPPQPKHASNPAPAPPQPKSIPGPQVGHRGKLEVTLWWETQDDLDLLVECPNGTISPNRPETTGPGICGDGVHDRDANRKMMDPVTNPSEHVFWNTDIPDVLYQVWVNPTYTKSGAPITYHVRVDFDGETRICSGQVNWDVGLGKGSAQFPIEFTPIHPLPSCENKDSALQLCNGDPKCMKP